MDIRIALKDPNWSCPPCLKICNCSICRNRTGKGATGPLALRAYEKGFMSVKHYLDNLNAKDDILDINYDPLDVKDDLLDVKVEPLDVKDEPLEIVDIKDEPFYVKDEPLDIKDELLYVKEEPLDIKDELLDINDEHLDINDEPLDINHQHLDVKYEPLIVKDEPLESNDDFHENIIDHAEVPSNDDDVVSSKVIKAEVMTIFPDFPLLHTS